MCNLYAMTSNQEAMRRLMRFARSAAGNLPVQTAIFPGFDAPVVRRGEDGERELAVLHWGFVLPQEGKAPKDVTNARSDKVMASRFWRGSFESRRCLVPATSFAEPQGRRPATWHWFALKGGEPRPLFAFAGLWRSWRGTYKGENVEIDTFAILTTAPNAVVRPIQHGRMPVILDPADYETWLAGPPEAALRLARPYPAEAMHVARSGADKEDPPLAA